jgi:hypothetical protein
LPLDHFANVSHFSVYPKGIPTEGLFGETRSFDVDVLFTVSDVPFTVSEESEIFLLEDGTPFAAYVKPAALPRGWTESGFFWLRARVEDLRVRCLRDGEEVGPEECDPLRRDDRILRTGRVDQKIWDQELAMLVKVDLVYPESTPSLEDSIRVDRPAGFGPAFHAAGPGTDHPNPSP